jgi:hypothetical protein
MSALAVLTVGLDAAVAADHQPPEQPAAGATASWAEVRVVAGDALRRLKNLIAHDGGNRDLNPFLARPEDVAGTLAAGRRRHRLVPVVDRASFVRRVR